MYFYSNYKNMRDDFLNLLLLCKLIQMRTRDKL